MEESLKIEEGMATNKGEKNLLHHIHKILSSPNKQEESHTLEYELRDPIAENETKKETTIELTRCVYPHQVIDKGINNTFILVNSLFLDEEKRVGCWGINFDGAHSIARSGVRVVLISPDK